jgi:hypothetical protein
MLALYLERRCQLGWNRWIRQVHRWLGVAFTVTVIANIVVMSVGQTGR